MTGRITAEIRAAGSDIVWVIQEAGQDVTIRRPGRPDAVARAVLFQLDDQDRTAKVADPAFKVMAWQGIFGPDAPVRSLPFTVIDAQGQHFVPVSPVQDPGEQGVALIAHLLPLHGRTRTELLRFILPGSGMVEDPRTGNQIPGPGSTLDVPVRLVASVDPQVRDMVGADAAEVALVGRWGTLDAPQQKPQGVRWGSTSPLVLDGQNGTLTIKLAYPDPDLAQEQQFGGRFVAAWRANHAS